MDDKKEFQEELDPKNETLNETVESSGNEAAEDTFVGSMQNDTQYRYNGSQIHQDTQTSQQWNYQDQSQQSSGNGQYQQWGSYQGEPQQFSGNSQWQGNGGYGQPPYGGNYQGFSQNEPPKPKKKGRAAKAFVAVLCTVVLIGGAFGASALGSYLGFDKAEADNNVVLAEGGSIDRTDATELQNSDYSSVADVVEDVSKSLATVITDNSTYATGVIVAEDDDYIYVATMYHVLSSAQQVQLIFGEDSDHVYNPELQGVDVDTDMAVLRVKKNDIDETQRSELKIATLGDSTGMVLGDLAITFSSPMGYYNTPSLGTISGLERGVSFSIANQSISLDMLQTDAAVNTSGVLVNGRGEIIGFTLDMTIEDSEGIGFAIPTSTAEDVISQIIQFGFVERPYMGFSGYNAMSFYPNGSTVSWAEYYGLPMGVLVADVTDDSPAAEAGLRVYDVIISFNGNAINNFEDMSAWLEQCEVGDTVTIEVLRNYMNGGAAETVELSITLQQKPQS